MDVILLITYEHFEIIQKVSRIGYADFRVARPDSWSLPPNPGGLATLLSTLGQ